MMGYKELKSRLMSTTAFLVACGTLIAMSAGGAQAAYPFALGGSAALGYQWLLQQSVDSIPSKVPNRTFAKVSCADIWTACLALQTVNSQHTRKCLKGPLPGSLEHTMSLPSLLGLLSPSSAAAAFDNAFY